jgi:hypothetical protein
METKDSRWNKVFENCKIRLDYERNEDILKEVKTTYIGQNMFKYKSNWVQHVDRI